MKKGAVNKSVFALLVLIVFLRVIIFLQGNISIFKLFADVGILTFSVFQVYSFLTKRAIISAFGPLVYAGEGQNWERRAYASLYSGFLIFYVIKSLMDIKF